MRTKTDPPVLPWFLFLFLFPVLCSPCTMVLCGPGSTRSGAVLLAHNNDLPGSVPSMIQVLEGNSSIDIRGMAPDSLPWMPPVPPESRMLIMQCHYGFSEGDAVAVNRWGVAVAGGVSLKDARSDRARTLDPLVKEGVSGAVRYIALQRSKTARECVRLMGRMYSEFGISYPSGVGIADVREVWYIEAGGGRCWVARRVPENACLAVANGYRIQAVDFRRPGDYIFPPYLEQFARDHGLIDPATGCLPFSRIFGEKRIRNGDAYNTRRVWRVQQLLSPSMNQKPNETRYPVMVIPDRPITRLRLFSLLRDHYQGTPFDPETHPGSRERIIGTLETVHTSVIELRSGVPLPVRGILWAGLGSSRATLYMPYYPGTRKIPEPFRRSSFPSAYHCSHGLGRLLADTPGLLDRYLAPGRGLEKVVAAAQQAVDEALRGLNARPGIQESLLTGYSRGLALRSYRLIQDVRRNLLKKKGAGRVEASGPGI